MNNFCLICSKVDLFREFDAADPEGTGFVEPEVAIDILFMRFEGLPKSCLRAMLQRYDTDNNNKVDVGEFLEFYSFVKAK